MNVDTVFPRSSCTWQPIQMSCAAYASLPTGLHLSKVANDIDVQVWRNVGIRIYTHLHDREYIA